MIVTLASVTGAPGVTTTALGLALRWPRASLLVETDPWQSVLAGYLRGLEAPDPNIMHVAAAAHRGAPDLRPTLMEAARPLPDDDVQRRRLLLPGPPTPWARTALEGSWPALCEGLAALDEAAVDVVVDFGQLPRPVTQTPSVLPAPLLEASGQVLVLVAPTLRAVTAARVLVDGLRRQADLAGLPGRLGLILRRRAWTEVPRREWFSDQEVSNALRVPVRGSVADDKAAADVLSDGAVRPRRWDRSALVKSLDTLAADLAAAAERRRIDVEVNADDARAV